MAIAEEPPGAVHNAVTGPPNSTGALTGAACRLTISNACTASGEFQSPGRVASTCDPMPHSVLIPAISLPHPLISAGVMFSPLKYWTWPSVPSSNHSSLLFSSTRAAEKNWGAVFPCPKPPLNTPLKKFLEREKNALRLDCAPAPSGHGSSVASQPRFSTGNTGPLHTTPGRYTLKSVRLVRIIDRK